MAGDQLNVTFNLPWPSSLLGANSRAHWRPKAAKTKAARWGAFFLAREAGIRQPYPKATLIFECHPPDLRRRDASNIPSLLKAYIDGIADAMNCDDNQFEVFYPPRYSDKIDGGRVVVNVRAGVVAPIRMRWL